jgi:ligand-binding SRPBCC domain-containing protein
MKTFQLDRETWLPCPIDEVFPFFADASNLAVLTPDWLQFRVVSDIPVEMAAGTRIDYRIRLRGIPIGWTSLISHWEPPLLFVDEQVRGPYRRWIHEHRFEAADDGTRVWGHVRYGVWGGRLVNRLMVEPDVERIFQLRADRLHERFGSPSERGAMGCHD